MFIMVRTSGSGWRRNGVAISLAGAIRIDDSGDRSKSLF